MKGLYKGFWITVCRDVPSYAIYFGSYEYFKYLLSNGASDTSLGVKFLSGGLAGSMSWICIYPIDIIKTRV